MAPVHSPGKRPRVGYPSPSSSRLFDGGNSPGRGRSIQQTGDDSVCADDVHLLYGSGIFRVSCSLPVTPPEVCDALWLFLLSLCFWNRNARGTDIYLGY